MRWYQEIKKDLFTFKEEKLSWMSVILIVVLDIFLFSLVLEGIEKEQRGLDGISVKYPYQCRALLNKSENSLSNYGNLSDYNGIKYLNKTKAAKSCVEVFNKYEAIKHSKIYVQNIAKYKEYDKEIDGLGNDLYKLRQKSTAGIREIRDSAEYKTLEVKRSSLRSKQANLPSLKQTQAYKDFRRLQITGKSKIEKEKENYKRKKIIFDYLYLLKFVIPLLALVMYFYSRHKKAEIKGKKFNSVILIMASHLIVILMIPFIWGTLHILYEFIPRKLLLRLVNFLTETGLLFIGYYVIAFIAVCLIFVLVYFLQKNEANKKLLRSKRQKELQEQQKREELERIKADYVKNVKENRCYNCTSDVDYENDNFCPYCQAELRVKCVKCGKEIYKPQTFCKFCGEDQTKKQVKKKTAKVSVKKSSKKKETKTSKK